MFGAMKDLFGEGISKALDSLKKIAVDTWHIDPEKVAQLDLEKTRILQDFEMKAQALELEYAKTDAADRDSARKREMALHDHTNAILAYTITGVMFVSTIYFNVYPPTPEVKPIVENVVMALRDGWLIVVAYYFGSSRSSATKQAALERLAGGEK